MKRSLLSLTGLALLLLLSQASCSTTEEVAAASEREVSHETCSLGTIESVSRCGGAEASCHVCGRPEGDEAVCLQPCTLGQGPGQDSGCPGSQRCVPIGVLRDGGGYARIGDCPAGYCQ